MHNQKNLEALIVPDELNDTHSEILVLQPTGDQTVVAARYSLYAHPSDVHGEYSTKSEDPAVMKALFTKMSHVLQGKANASGRTYRHEVNLASDNDEFVYNQFLPQLGYTEMVEGEDAERRHFGFERDYKPQRQQIRTEQSQGAGALASSTTRLLRR